MSDDKKIQTEEEVEISRDTTEEPVEQIVEEEVIEQNTDDYKEKWQRAVAEMENMRKRFEQDRLTHSKYALEGFIEDILPVVDNFYRATDHVPADLQASPWVTGMLYIQKNLLDVLEQRGVNEIPVKPGDPFDPTKHEAISVAEGSDFNEHQVAEVKNKGYLLRDRVIRPAQVTVGSLSVSEKIENNK